MKFDPTDQSWLNPPHTAHDTTVGSIREKKRVEIGQQIIRARWRDNRVYNENNGIETNNGIDVGRAGGLFCCCPARCDN